jgi:peptidyl-prolyl cis-trans isomerase C
VVLKVGDQQATAADLDFVVRSLNPQEQRTLLSQGRQQLGDQYALTILLAQQALHDHLDNLPEYRRAEAFDRAKLLANAAYQKLAQDIKVTPEEVSQYFNAHKDQFEQVEIRQFGVRKKGEPVAPNPRDPAVQGLSAEEAKAKIESIHKAISSGEDVNKVAKEHAVPNVVFVQATPQTVGHNQLPPNLDKTVFTLKPGEVSPIEDSPQFAYFVQMVKPIHPELKDVSPTIENEIRQEKLKSEVASLKEKSKIWMDPQYFQPAQAAVPAPTLGAPSAGPATGAVPTTPSAAPRP